MTIYSEQYYGSMDPQYSQAMSNAVFKNYYFGAPTDTTKALQIPSITKLATSGIMNAEIGVIDPSHWEAMPKAQFETIRQMAKLQMGEHAKLNVHAPISPDPTGFREQKYSKENREYAVNFFKDIIDKAAIMQIDNNVPVGVNIHASGHDAPPAQFYKWDPEFKDEKGKKVGRLEEQEKYVVDPETGQVTVAKRETVYFPTGPQPYTPDDRIRNLNYTFWEERKREISNSFAEMAKAEEHINSIRSNLAALKKDPKFQNEPEIQKIDIKHPETWPAEFQSQYVGWARHLGHYEQNYGTMISNSFDKAVKALEISNAIDPKKYGELYKSWKSKYEEMQKNPKAAAGRAYELMDKNLSENEHYPVPVFIPMEQFAEVQAAQSFSEAAMYSYDKYDAKGKKGPNILVENPMPWLAMGRGEDLARGIKKSREMFAEKLMEEHKLSKEKADAIAEEKIGATWDIAHSNILRRFGIPPTGTTQEAWEKHFKKETGEIKKDIKHIHLSDNFGFSDMHMAPGMGNVPIKEFMNEMAKEGRLKEVTTILESAGVAVHLGIPPSHPEAMRYFGMPLYGWQTDPNWGEAGKNYFFGSGGVASGYGKILPDIHYTEYGSGFSQLPTALGGVRESERGKFAGTPMS